MAHLRQQLREIDQDAAAGRIQPPEVTAAKAELARELIRVKGRPAVATATRAPRGVTAAVVGATAVLALGVYTALGQPGLPAAPLATRTDIPAPGTQLTLEEAVARIEAQLEKTPDDMRALRVIAPAYMQMQRFADAAAALRKVIAAEGATADLQTDLGEAVMMANGGEIAGEPLELFRAAAASDPAHVRSRYYLASAAMQSGDLEAAKTLWTELIGLAKGDESWLSAARAGLAAAEGDVGQFNDDAIKGMVEQLSTRLASDGGSVEEWTRLVRSYLVLGETEAAQKAYDSARLAYPDAAERQPLDVLAADNGLVIGK